MKRHLQEKSLEGMSIIVCVRWMLFAPIAFGIVVGISIALSGSPDCKQEPTWIALQDPGDG